MTSPSADPDADNPDEWDDLVLVPEIAQKLKVHEETVREYFRAGLLRGTRGRGKAWKSRRRWVDQFIDDTAQGGGPPPRPVRVRADRQRGKRSTPAAA